MTEPATLSKDEQEHMLLLTGKKQLRRALRACIQYLEAKNKIIKELECSWMGAEATNEKQRVLIVELEVALKRHRMGIPDGPDDDGEGYNG